MSALADFEAERDRLVAEIDKVTEDAVKETLLMLDSLRKRVIEEMKQAQPLKDNVFRMRQLQRTIEAYIQQFETQLEKLISEELTAGLKRGAALVDESLAQLGVSFSMSAITGLDQHVAATAKAFSADLIQGVTNELRAKINSVLRRSVLGSVNLQDVINELGRTLESKGTFRSIAARAEAIARTEILRIHSQATQTRMLQHEQQMKAAGYDLLKSWLATHDNRTRPTHRIAGMDYGEKDAIPVDEPFIVGGEEALYPRDPALSPEESVNCRCVSLPIVKKAVAASSKAA